MSLTIIDNIEPPSPRWVYEPVPTFRTTLEEDRYWDEQYRRWSEGHLGLTGPHYFYLQECHLKDIYGDIFRPKWRDVDDFIFGVVDECRANLEGLLLYKRREVGATSVFAGGLPFWYMRMYPGATINMTSKDQEGLHKMFGDKVMTTYDRINEILMNPVPDKKNFTKQSLYLRIALKKLEADGKIGLRYSDLNLKETSERPDSPNNFSGSRAIYTYVDEAPLHKRIKLLLKSIEATMKKGTERKGFFAMAGTVEESLQGAELASFHQLIKDSKFFNIRSVLVPAWMGLDQFMVNGHSDEKKGMEWIESEHERLAKAEDQSFLRAFKRNYPRNEEDIFDLGQGGMFEDDVADILNEVYRKLMEGPEKDIAYKMVPVGEEVVATPNATGSFFIYEMPKPGVQYFSCIDGVATGTESGAEEGSKVACVIFKGFDPMGGSFSPVCVYYERPKTIEGSYICIENQFRFYNKFDGFKQHHGFYYETNAATGDHFATFLRKANLFQYAAKRSDLSGKGYMDTKKYGQAVTIQVRDWQVRQANIFLRKYASNIKMKVFIRALMESPDVNSDIRDAFFMFMIAIPNFDKPVAKKQERKYRSIPQLVDTPNGKMWVERKVLVSGTEQAIDNIRVQQFIDQMTLKYGSNAYNHKMSTAEREIYDELLGSSRRHGNF